MDGWIDSELQLASSFFYGMGVFQLKLVSLQEQVQVHDDDDDDDDDEKVGGSQGYKR